MNKQPQTLKTRTIALVLDPSFGKKVETLAREMPVWIVESQANTEAVNEVRECSQDFFEVTVFFKRAGESKKEQFARALYGLEEHQGKTSVAGGYDNLLIYSNSLEEIDLHALKELDFCTVQQPRNVRNMPFCFARSTAPPLTAN